VKLSAVDIAPAHTAWLVHAATEGVGLTVIVNVWAAPEQPFAIGMTTIVATTGADVLFVAVKPAILPVPLAARPMLVVVFVQL
jgi:hypothetical protein